MGLWNFITNLFRATPAKPSTPGGTDSDAELAERGIFVYWDGQKKRNGDPLAIARILREDPEFIYERHMAEMSILEKSPNITSDDAETALEALRISSAAARRAFALPSFEDGGLSEAECIGLLSSNAEYSFLLKKNGNGPPTSLQTGSDSTPSLDSAAMPAEEYPTNVPSASL